MYLRLCTLFCLLGLTSCYRNQEESAKKDGSRKYVHKYGVELSEKEWKEYGMHGDVISTSANGVTITEQYNHNVLHGAKTWSFPNSQAIYKTALYDTGTCTKEIIHDTSGLPLSEIEFVSEERQIHRTFSRGGFPYSIETIDQGILYNGEYFDTEGKLYAAVVDFNGLRVMRDFEGIITRSEKITGGKPSLITEYYPSGNPKSITPCDQGIPHGIRRTFFESSEPASIEPFCEGKLDGTVLLFADGIRACEVPYVSGLRQGTEYRYDGRRLVHETNWKKGRKHGISIDHANPEMPQEWYWEGEPVTQFTFEQRVTSR